MSGDDPKHDDAEPLDQGEAHRRIDSIRENLHIRPRAGSKPPVSDRHDEPEPPERSILDDPAAMAASMERAVHNERIEAALAERDDRIRQLEAEVARLRLALGRVLAAVGDAVAAANVESSPTEGSDSGS